MNQDDGIDGRRKGDSFDHDGGGTCESLILRVEGGHFIIYLDSQEFVVVLHLGWQFVGFNFV